MKSVPLIGNVSVAGASGSAWVAMASSHEETGSNVIRSAGRRRSGELGKVLLVERQGRPDPAGPGGALPGAELHPPDLPGDGLGQLGELQPPNALVRGQALPHVAEDVPRQLARRSVAGPQGDERLGHREPQGI